MKRRAFLKFLGLAPVAAAVPAMALPRAEKPTEIGRAGFLMETTTSQHHGRISAVVECPIDIDALNRDLEGSLRWMNEGTRHAIAECNRITNA
ncbi:hypothetical protein JS562_37555 [Agrobacterium sp. S2]|nr:hypothetical protein [Agrobacterium sp. S2]